MYTTSSLFLKTLSDAGITHAFVNWGSDHPALLEDLERQRVEAGEAGAETLPRIVTCPNEMVALSAAQGYAQVTGKPAAVIVHVDVGTQAMAGAIHNVDRCRTPVLIYAGATPFTDKGELKGSRNEWIMWLQDIPDQTAIVRQYMRFTSQISSGKNVPQVVHRALQMATSYPKGPVYLWGRREAMEEEVDTSLMEASVNLNKWPSVEPSALPPTAVNRIATALLTARSPLIITSHLGRNPHAIPPLLSLSTLLSIPIVSTCPSVVNVPFSHPYYAGVSYLAAGTHTPHLAAADVVLLIDTDVPWIPSHGPNDRPSDDARVFVVDSSDPLKNGMGYWHVDAEMVCHADPELALSQVMEAVRWLDERGGIVGESVLRSKAVKERGKDLEARHAEWIRALEAAENSFSSPSAAVQGNAAAPAPFFTAPNVLGVLRKTIETHTPSRGTNVLVLNEGITAYPLVWSHLRPEGAGSQIASGGSSLGWALGAAVGASIGGQVAGQSQQKRYDLVVVVVGDGSFMFGVPSSAYWMARKYNTPFLTIVLNNGGWKSPKLSALGVYPNGHASKAPGHKLTVGFGPDSPDYSKIAVAASADWAWGERVGMGQGEGKEFLEAKISEAVKVVVEERRCAVVECVLESI